ncbi:MAG: amidohydrolase family protein [Planctomycetota bacterium]|jgi:predicted TIM-barrel fold metal-dependent hydrolase
MLLIVVSARAGEPPTAIPRIDAHAHCGSPDQMQYGEHLVAWVDLNFLRSRDVSAEAYLEATSKRYQHRFLPCLHDAIRDGLQYGPDDVVGWQKRGVVGLKIWVGVSDAIDRPQHDPLFAKMAEIALPGASIHIAQPYPTSWCEDPIQFWRAQNAWERVLDRHPNLVVVNAHMLDHFNSDEQLDYLAYMLTTYPNLHVDLAARFQQFHRMDRERLRDFMIRYQDRILFGTDIGRVGEDARGFAERYHRCFLLLQSDKKVKGSFFDNKTERRGLALPRDVLEKIYYRNALRIYPRARDTLKTLGYAAPSDVDSQDPAK